MKSIARWMAAWACLGMLIGPAARSIADEPNAGPARAASAPPARAAKPLDLSFIPPQAVAAIVLHPQPFFTEPGSEWLPTEIISAQGIKETGVDPVKIKEAVVLFASPARGTDPELGAILRFSEPYSKEAIGARIIGRESDLAGKKVLEIGGPKALLGYFADDKTIVIGSAPLLEKMLTAGKDADSPLLRLLKGADTSAHATVVFSIDAVRPLMKQAIAAAPPVPPPLDGLLKLPDMLSAIVLRVNAGERFSASLTLRAVDDASAEQIENVVILGLTLARQAVQAEMAAGAQKVDPVQQASLRYAVRITNKIFDQLKPVRKGQNVRMAFESDASVAVLGVMAGLLLPAVQAARMSARRVQSMNNLKQIGLALFNFESNNRHFPARAIFSNEGKPLLSWRVAILPFVEENELFKQFHLDEPWDSEHNKALLDKMPPVFKDPRRPPGTTTNYLAAVGKGLAFDGDKGLSIASFTDGTSNTLLVVQVNDDRAVPWTKPDDLEVDLKKPLDGLGEAEGTGFSALFADGHVALLSKTIKEETLRRLFGRADGLPVDENDLNP